MPATRPLEERFWEKVNKQGPLAPHMKTRCWVWEASTDKCGYGWIGLGPGRKMGKSNRVAWELQHGKRIPDGLYALHKCDNPSCVRPGHIYLGTQKQNAADRKRRGHELHPKGKDHWAVAHPEWLHRGDAHWARRARPWRGGLNCKAKLTAEQVREIRRAFDPATMEYADLAAKYQVSSSTVGNIIRRETWAED